MQLFADVGEYSFANAALAQMTPRLQEKLHPNRYI